MFFHLLPRLPQEFRMSIKTFLTETLKNINLPANSPDAVKKLEDETVYLDGASQALKAVGAVPEHQLTEKARGLFKQKIALIDAQVSLQEEIANFDENVGD